MVHPDLDDTVAPRRTGRSGAPAVEPEAPDLDDTVIVPPGTGRRPGTQPEARPGPRPAGLRPMQETAPPRYAFRVGAAGRPVELHTTVYVGRSPRVPRIPSGAPPTLVTVPSPRGEVSGTHLEVRQLGASVIVTDLRSTNGSSVAVPGSSPHTLRQGESMVVSPGTLVDIGDGNVIEILPLRRHPLDE